MKLFTKSIDDKLFKQYPKGGDLENQMVVAKIFNPYGRGAWYIINSDPDEPDYLWAIVDLMEVEVGSVSRNDLESIKVPPFRLSLERDMYFTPVNAQELYRGLLSGKRYDKGGETEGSENKEMLENQTKAIQHHAKELEDVIKKTEEVEPWIITKVQRASTDMADVTHYLEGENSEKYAEGGEVEGVDLFEDYDSIPAKVQKVLDKHSDAFEYGDYRHLEKAHEELKKIGYTFEYGLDGEAYDLRKIGQRGTEEDEYAKGGKLKVGHKFKYEGKDAEILSKKDGMYFIRVHNYHDNGDMMHTVLREEDFKKMAYGGRLDVGRYYRTKDGRQVRYLGDSIDPELGTFMNKADGVFKVRYDEIESKASIFSEGGKTNEDGSFVELKVGDKVRKFVRPNLNFPRREMGFVGEILSINRAIAKVSFPPNDKEISIPLKFLKKIDDKMAEGGNVKGSDKKYHIQVFDENGKIIESKIIMASNQTEASEMAFNHYPSSFWKKYKVEKIRVYPTDWAEGGMMAEGGEVWKKGSTITFKTKSEANKRLKLMKDDGSYKNLKVEATTNGWAVKFDFKGNKMAMGGRVKFADKVKAVKKSLLERKKVPKAVQKDYGKTFSPKEAEDSAKRIVGAATAKERLKMRIKNSKKK